MLYYFLDTETAGLSIDDPILTVAIVSCDRHYNLVEQVEYGMYLPGYYNTDGAFKVNQIDMVEHKKKYEGKFFDNLRELYLRLNNSVVLAHNADFDMPRLFKMFTRNGYGFNTLRSRCTMKLTAPYYGYRGRVSLANLAKKLNVPKDLGLGTDFHNALYDARVAYECMKRVPQYQDLESVLK